jgi:hypothetical protein
MLFDPKEYGILRNRKRRIDPSSACENRRYRVLYKE